MTEFSYSIIFFCEIKLFLISCYYIDNDTEKKIKSKSKAEQTTTTRNHETSYRNLEI